MAIKKIEEFAPADRYVYDFGVCSMKNGFAQIDTSEDAHYYGNWASPSKRAIVSYVEGDVTTVICDTDEEFVQQMREFQRWAVSIEYWKGVDAYGTEDQWHALGLGDMLH